MVVREDQWAAPLSNGKWRFNRFSFAVEGEPIQGLSFTIPRNEVIVAGIKCQKCGLFSPDNAQRCDCGWDFVTGRRETSDATLTSSVVGPSWICATCNIVAPNAELTGKSKKTCPHGHELSEVTGFWPMVMGLTIAWPIYRAGFLLLGLVWAPLEQFWGYGLLAWIFIVLWMPVRGTLYVLRGGPVRRLAPSCFGMAVGSLLGMAVTGGALMLMFGKVTVR